MPAWFARVVICSVAILFVPISSAKAGWLIGLRGGQSIYGGVLITDDAGANLMTNDPGTFLATPDGGPMLITNNDGSALIENDASSALVVPNQ